MLAGWLAQLPRKYAKHVYHFHDKRPPDILRELPPPPATVDARTGLSGQAVPGRRPVPHGDETRRRSG